MNLNNKVPIAVQKHSKFNLPFDHVSTGMFMLLQPLYYKHCLKGENNKFDFTSVVRPNPLVVPTFGRIRQNLRHFFVPYRLIFPNWEDFINDTVASNFESSSQVNGVPYFTSDSLVNLFIQNQTLTTTVDGVDPNKVDIHYGQVYYKFTRLGRRFFKILYSLGYELVMPSKSFKFNALALLAYARVYADWYANSQYLDSLPFLTLKQLCSFNDPTTALELSVNDLYQILIFVQPAVYDSNNYFEDAWDNAVAPNGSQFTSFQFLDPSHVNGAYVSTLANGTPEMQINSDVDSYSIGTDYIHTALKKLSQYQKRHALAGARSIDRVLADYGFTTDYLRISRSIYVGVSSFDVDIKSVYATANGVSHSGESVVGDFAGAGFGAGNNSIDFTTDEEGIFLSVSTIQPSGGYYQGYDRHNRHITREQFFTESFDALGVQSIEKGEVYVSHDEDFASVGDDYANHFGFTGRYGEYKRSISRVSGDIALKSALLGGHAWHLMREFNDVYFDDSINNVVHSEDFARGTDAEQYLRMFTYTEFDLDPFNIFLHVDNVCYAPCAPLTDDLTFDDLTSQKITLNSAGPKVN